MVQTLHERLIIGFHRCSKELHEEKLREHVETACNDHHGLEEIFNDPEFPSVLGLSEMITPERLVRQKCLAHQT